MNQPSEVALDVAPTSPVAEDPEKADAVIAFFANRDQVERMRDTFAARVALDALTWVAYPKAGQLGTDLNRDILGNLLSQWGMQPVRQISINAVWSALRIRPS